MCFLCSLQILWACESPVACVTKLRSDAIFESHPAERWSTVHTLSRPSVALAAEGACLAGEARAVIYTCLSRLSSPECRSTIATISSPSQRGAGRVSSNPETYHSTNSLSYSLFWGCLRSGESKIQGVALRLKPWIIYIHTYIYMCCRRGILATSGWWFGPLDASRCRTKHFS